MSGERESGEGMRNDEVRPLSYADLRRFFFLVLGFVVAALLVGALAKVLLLFAVVLFVAMVLNTPVAWLQRRGMGRGVAVVLVMFISIGIVGGLISLIVPPILEQSNDLVAKVPDYAQNIESQIERLGARYPALDGVIPETQTLIDQAGHYVEPAVGWLLTNTFGLVGKLFIFIIGVLLTVFVLSNPMPLVAGVLGVTPERHRDATRRSMVRIMQQMAAWTRATLMMGAITGLSTGVLLHFVGVRPALLFGVLAGFGELVPNLGPVIAAVPAMFVAAGEGPTTFFYALAAILFVQQIESNVLVPYIMGTQMELHPLSIIFFALGMGSLFGIAGAILAVPTAATIKILYDEFYLRPSRVPVEQIELQASRLVMGEEMPEEPAPAKSADTAESVQ